MNESRLNITILVLNFTLTKMIFKLSTKKYIQRKEPKLDVFMEKKIRLKVLITFYYFIQKTTWLR